MNADKKIADLCIASIKRHSLDPKSWRYTNIAVLHPELSRDFRMESGELPLVSCYISPASWYVISTRRVIGMCNGNKVAVDAHRILEDHFVNFKGIGNKNVEVFTIRTAYDREIRFEFETGKASMAPIYALKTLLPKVKKLYTEQSGAPDG